MLPSFFSPSSDVTVIGDTLGGAVIAAATNLTRTLLHMANGTYSSIINNTNSSLPTGTGPTTPLPTGSFTDGILVGVVVGIFVLGCAIKTCVQDSENDREFCGPC